MFVRIIFGTYSVRIKEVDADLINSNPRERREGVIDVRQKCFHLFYIPVFPIKKLFLLKSEHGVSELSSEQVVELKKKIKLRTPFYSFGWIIIGLLSLLWSFTSYEWNRSAVENRLSDDYEKQVAVNEERLTKLDTTDYIKFMETGWAEDNGVYGKIEFVSKDSVMISKLVTDFSEKEQFISHKVRSFYFSNEAALKQNTVSIQDLQRTICSSYDSVENRSFKGVQIFGGNRFYRMEYVERLDGGPSIKWQGTGGLSNGNLLIELSNVGERAKLVKIENKGSNVHWKNSLPQVLEQDDIDVLSGYSGFNLVAENYTNEVYHVILHLESESGKTYAFELKGQELDLIVKRL